MKNGGKDMITISLCMIVKNEEAHLARCLDSIADVMDEIIIVDTGSTDATKEIAAKYTDKVLDFPWINDFSAARNFAYINATMDYQMWLDADDVLPEEEKEALLKLKQTLDPAYDMVTMKYHASLDQDGQPLLTSTRERLTKREKNYRWQDPVHECIPLQGNIYHSDITIWHHKPFSTAVSTRNLDIYEAIELSGRQFTPRQVYYFARELKDHGKYAKAAYYFQRFLDSKAGWGEDNIATCYNLAICYQALGDNEKIVPILLRSFEFAAPRAEICCELGYYYMRREIYTTALDWFNLAANLPKPDSLGFILADYWGYIPYIESCVCYCRLQRYDEAEKYNNLAAKIKPEATAVLQNRQYLQEIQEQQKHL